MTTKKELEEVCEVQSKLCDESNTLLKATDLIDRQSRVLSQVVEALQARNNRIAELLCWNRITSW